MCVFWGRVGGWVGSGRVINTFMSRSMGPKQSPVHGAPNVLVMPLVKGISKFVFNLKIPFMMGIEFKCWKLLLRYMGTDCYAVGH